MATLVTNEAVQGVTSGQKGPEFHIHESFDDMNIPDDVLRGIYAFGFEKPSAIQQRGIVPIIQGRDVLAQAQSGTGKTGAFTIGLTALYL